MRGIVLASTLLFASASAQAAPAKDFSAQAEVTQATKLWTEPTKFGEAMARLQPGLELKVLNYSTTGSWAKIRTPGGREGWVPVRHTSLSSNKDYIAKFRRGERRPANTVVNTNLNKTLFAAFYGQYSNQFSLGKAHGFGLGITGGYFLNDWFAAGLWLGMDRFTDTAKDSIYKVSRSAYRYFVGPAVQARWGHFAVDAALGLDMVKSNFTIKERYSGSTVRNRCAGGETNMTVGLNLRPSYLMPLGARTSLQIFTAYGVGFHSKDACIPGGGGSIPQQISAGLGINTPL